MQLQPTDIGYCHYVEVYPNDPTTNKIWQFPDIPYLREKSLLSISVKMSTNGINTGKNNLGPSIASASNLVWSPTLTLVDKKGNQFIQNLPLLELIPTTNNTSFYGNRQGFVIFKPTLVAWSKCFIKFQSLSGISATSCVSFNIFYK